jgi:hypothetical protein
MSTNLARALAVLTLLCTLGQGVVFATGPRSTAAGEFGFPGYQAIFAFAYISVGYLIATRRPAIPIGWSLLVAGLAIAIDGLAHEYALHSARGPALPAGSAAIWVDAWLWAVNTGALLFTIFRFPDGRPVGPRWVWAERVMLAFVGIALLMSAFVPGTIISSGLENPLGLEAFRWIPPALTNAPGIPVTILTVAALVARFRRSRRLERQQLKWLVAAMTFVTVIAAAMVTLQLVVPEVAWLAQTILVLATPLIPISIGVAVLRYRLYEIDVIVRRTLVYGALSVAVLLTYLALVVVVQAALRPFTAGSELAVAASTLGTLALVQPFRRSIQTAVDRRFYRSTYDSARTLDTFAARMRDEVDINSVRAGVLDVVGATLQPAHASVWLREEGPAT